MLKSNALGAVFAALLGVLQLSGDATAQARRVPAPADFLGYALGERFTDVTAVLRYFDVLAAASPRIRVHRYGESVEHRPLTQVIIAREDYLQRLDSILARNRALTDPDAGDARVNAIARDNPAVVYFSYGVHGNESSSSEAAMWTAYDLLSGSSAVAGVLDSVIVVIDPVVNPDGRDRYVGWYRSARADTPNANVESREHQEPWPGGRTNHYLFDLNRDWAWATQPETRARLETWNDWNPQVHVDFHEMSHTSSYFFFPAAAPINPLYPEHILAWGKYFGQSNAAAFDREGWAYYTGEAYDLFYPGYGDSWPSLTGAIGMTYEQAGGSRAGLAVRRPDGTLLTLRDRAEHHRTAGNATLRAAALRRTQLLTDFAQFHRSTGTAMQDVLLVPGANAQRTTALVSLLRTQGIEVERAGASFTAEAGAYGTFAARRDFPAGTYRVRARQPRGRLAMTLLQPETLLKGSFSYDISAWSLPYAYGVEAHRAARVPDARWSAVVGADTARTAVANGSSPAAQPYGYLVRPGLDTWRGIARLLQSGGRAIVLEKPFTSNGTRWPAGTVFISRIANGDVTARIAAAGLQHNAVPIQSGLSAEGNDAGTERSIPIRQPRIALLYGDRVDPSSYGVHWFFLERTLGVPFDAVQTSRLERMRWEDYDVLVIPELLSDALSDKQLDAIKAWVTRGGTVIAVGAGARAVATPLAEIKPREQPKQDADLERALRGRAAREQDRWESEIPGTILTVQLDAAHPLTFGAGAGDDASRMFVLHAGDLVFEPDDSYESVAFFPAKSQKVSGVISPENLERLSRGTWLAAKNVGSGKVFLFADDPLFRHFWYGTFQLYANALFLGPKS